MEFFVYKAYIYELKYIQIKCFYFYFRSVVAKLYAVHLLFNISLFHIIFYLFNLLSLV